MALANHFYNQTTRRYIALFGSLFNKMSITREDNQGVEQQRMVVPISYGPYQKFLARITQDPGLNRPQAISLPRMSFEMITMFYDGTRKLSSTGKLCSTTDGNFMYNPVPYNIEFNLYIMTKHAEDGTKILEQILPFFKPDYTFSAKIIDDLDPIDLPLVLNSISSEDMYEADFETRRSLMWTLSFTFKGWFFGPSRESKIIKFIDVRNHTDTPTNTEPETQITVRPGLTANGEPTSDANSSIDYLLIDADDDWGIITIIDDYEGEP